MNREQMLELRQKLMVLKLQNWNEDSHNNCQFQESSQPATNRQIKQTKVLMKTEQDEKENMPHSIHQLVNTKSLKHIDGSAAQLPTLQQLIPIMQLGQGSFGKVSLVQFKSQMYALKTMSKRQIIDMKQVVHVQNEKQILSSINNPFVVKLYKHFQDENNLYLLLEFVQGGELFHRLRKDGRFSNDIALFYSLEVLSVLEDLHKEQMIYRDLKPENIMLDGQGHVKLVDFGFAKKLDPNARTFTLCGTPEYLAPEVLIDGKTKGYGYSVDYWAFGVLLYEMMVGHPPFYDNDPQKIYKQILKGQINFPEFLSEEAKSVIQSLMTQKVENRLGIAKEVRSHRWFLGVDFKKVIAKQIKVPYFPSLKDKGDLKYFENSNINDNKGVGVVTQIEQSLFADF